MWIEAQAAQYITTFTTCKVLDLSQNSIRLPRRNAITSKAENYIKIQRKQGTSNTPPQQQKKRQKRSNRSYKGKGKDKDTSLHSLSEIIRKHILRQENRESNLGHRKKDLTRQPPLGTGTKSCTVDHIRHRGGRWKRRGEERC